MAVKTKIAITIERIDIALGGAERSVFELAAALSALNVDVTILAAKGRTEMPNITILCDSLPGKRTLLGRFARALRQHFAEHHYDIIHSVLPFDFAHVYQPRGGSYTETILRNAASYENRIVALCKTATAPLNLHRTALLRAERDLCRNPRGPLVVAISHYVAMQFRRHYNLANDRIVTIPNGVALSSPADSARARKLLTQILSQLPPRHRHSPILFLFVANNFRLKGLAPLIKAFRTASIEKPNSPACLVVAGHGPSLKYRHLAKKLAVDDRIVFLGSLRSVQDALSITDVAVLPTFYDPASRFILEALTAAKPVITTAFNGAADLFTDNRHGKVIDDPRNTSALARALNHFSDKANITAASDAIIHDDLRQNIGIDRVANQLMSLYESILQKGKPK